ncbi:hypothetical protein [Acidimangrovimonas pyrenivorans]|uniref:Uncharacterized protein n=1 Tax=Acidimangrovimonas pyrenivorans TaxID=2030798 RepID=A0ABV7AL89_9RHOB
MKTSEHMSAEERRDTWVNLFAVSDGSHTWDFAQWYAELLYNALEYVEGLVGAEHAAQPLLDLAAPVAESGGEGGADWREVLEDVMSAGMVWPMSERINHAGLYGLYGVTPEAVPQHERADWIADMVATVSAFAERSDVRALGDGNNAILRIANMASSRHALDTGTGEVDIRSMATLGGVSEGRVRNLLAGSEPTLERGPHGGVSAMSALAWLQKRQDFLASIWMEQEGSDIAETTRHIDPERMIFVPVARDGSTFHPGLRRGGSYQIGAKGEEQHFDGFDEALAALNAMPIPRWRRPNEHGNWGIVSGVAWQRVERSGAAQ